MKRDSETLRIFEREYPRARYASMTFEEALRIFAALWNEAAMLDPEFPARWRGQLEADLNVARALNGLPPRG